MKILIYIGTVKTIIPWNGTQPNLEKIPEYAHTAILNAFDNGNYELMPSTVIIDDPDWSGFTAAVFFNTHWQTWEIPQDARTAIITAAVAELKEKFDNAYGIAKQITPPSPSAIAVWQSLADQYHLPLTF